MYPQKHRFALERVPKDGTYQDATVKGILQERVGRYTVFVRWPGDCIEEIDVNALDYDHAKKIALAALEADYEPDWTEIAHVEKRVGWYW